MDERKRIELRISQFLVGNTYDPRTGNQVPLEIKRDITGTDEPDGDVFLGDVEFVVSVPATFNVSTLARVISEELSVSENREHHPDVEHLLSLFEYTHLPPHLRTISAQFWNVAHDMVRRLDYGTELLVGMRKLLEAKDCMVRQAVIDDRKMPNEPEPWFATDAKIDRHEMEEDGL